MTSLKQLCRPYLSCKLVKPRMINATSTDTYHSKGSTEFSATLDLHDKYNMHLIQFRIRRTCEYATANGKAMLKVVEMQEIRGITERVEGTRTIHNLSKQPSAAPGGPLDTWYQLSIMSPAIDVLLRPNEELEFGDVTELRLDDLAKTVVADLCRPACEVVRNIDGVGFYNNNNIKNAKTDWA